MSYMHGVVDRAWVFATAAHAAVGQVRKYTGEPYIVHPAEVAATVARYGGTDAMIAAAWLHDVIEDTFVDADVLRDIFGYAVTDLVVWLTDTSTPADGNRATRKAIDRARLAMAPPEVQTIKLADISSNTSSIIEDDPEFSVVYLREMSQLLDVMTQGHPELYAMARSMIR